MSPAPSSTTGSLTGEQIYLKAVHAMRAEAVPSYVEFRLQLTTRNLQPICTADGNGVNLKHGDFSGSYHVWFRSKASRAVSEDEQSHKRCNGSLLVPSGDEIVSLGAPTPSPSASTSPSPAPTGAPPLIGTVRIEAARYYRITLVDRESFEGHPVYHLALRAYRDPNEHPLTEMLVDADTFLVRKATGAAALHYVVASGNVSGSGVFDRIGPYWVIRDEAFDLAGYALFMHVHGTAALRGSDYTYPADLSNFFPSPSPSPSAAPRRR